MDGSGFHSLVRAYSFGRVSHAKHPSRSHNHTHELNAFFATCTLSDVMHRADPMPTSLASLLTSHSCFQDTSTAFAVVIFMLAYLDRHSWSYFNRDLMTSYGVFPW